MSTIRLDASERWAASPMGRASRAMALIALGSVAGHVLLVGATVVSSQPPPAPPQEIAVEVVQEVPKTPEPVKRAAAEPVKQTAARAPEPPKRTAAEPVKQTAAHAPEPPKPEPKPELPPKTKAASIVPPPEPKVDAQEQKLAALQRELDSLRAEPASLQAERTAEAAQAQTPPSLHDAGLGPLPSSFQAVALPAAGDGAAEAASYQEIVFSALAKAKGFGRTKGVPGSAGVRFSLDAGGRLVDVELVHKSGVPSLDAEALDIVRRAAFPPPPQGAQRSFVANVNFVTEGAQ